MTDEAPVPEEKEAAPDFVPLRLVDLFIKPGRLMAHVGRWPRWWQAGLLLLIINGVFTTWVTPIMVEEQRETITSSRFTDLVDRDQIMEQLDRTAEGAEKNKLGSILANGLIAWALTIVLAVFLHFFIKLAGGQGRYPQAFGIVHWAALIPYGLGTLIKLPLILHTGEYARISLSAGMLLPAEMVGGALFNFLAYLTEVTHLWGLVVIVIGFEKIYGLQRGPAILSVLLPWALGAAVMAGYRTAFGF